MGDPSPSPPDPRGRGPEPTFRERVEAVKEVTNLFRVERAVYLILTTSALLLLILSAIAMIVRQGPQVAVLVALFGSSGLITLSLGRVLRMWERALDLLQPLVEPK